MRRTPRNGNGTDGGWLVTAETSARVCGSWRLRNPKFFHVVRGEKERKKKRKGGKEGRKGGEGKGKKENRI